MRALVLLAVVAALSVCACYLLYLCRYRLRRCLRRDLQGRSRGKRRHRAFCCADSDGTPDGASCGTVCKEPCDASRLQEPDLGLLCGALAPFQTLGHSLCCCRRARDKLFPASVTFRVDAGTRMNSASGASSSVSSSVSSSLSGSARAGFCSSASSSSSSADSNSASSRARVSARSSGCSGRDKRTLKSRDEMSRMGNAAGNSAGQDPADRSGCDQEHVYADTCVASEALYARVASSSAETLYVNASAAAHAEALLCTEARVRAVLALSRGMCMLRKDLQSTLGVLCARARALSDGDGGSERSSSESDEDTGTLEGVRSEMRQAEVSLALCGETELAEDVAEFRGYLDEVRHDILRLRLRDGSASELARGMLLARDAIDAVEDVSASTESVLLGVDQFMRAQK
ncbi:MC146 [Molluscum contagiosum virus subtype 1]|nr:MC146 [Molluscum contagiosum virus subtype 1]DBA42777.1 TPA_asm: MC146R [Molluscum contagiosum virus]